MAQTPLPQSSRRILVDDAHEAIQYSGSWFTDHGDARLGNFGAPLERTLHGIPAGSTSTFTFQYEGSSIDVYGTVTENFTATWTCTIDGRNIGRTGYDIPGVDSNRWKLCEWNSGEVGKHILTVTATSARDTFFFDYLRFVPAPGDESGNNLVQIQNEDPAITYQGGNWNFVPDFAHITDDARSSVAFTFVGASVEWYGYVPRELQGSSSRGSYSIDDGASVTFQIPSLPSRDSPSEYNQLFFKTPSLSSGSHTITVTYLGLHMPLTLDYFIVDNRTASFLAPSESTPSPTTNSGSIPSQPQKLNAAVIAGAVIGTLLGLCSLCALGFFFLRWRRRSNLPMIQPLPGFIRQSSSAPLDIDLVNTRLSDEIFPPGSRPRSLGHARRRSAPRRQFNPEIRSTLNSINLSPPPVQHAPPSTTNTGDNDSIVELTDNTRPISTAETTNTQLNPYEAGYPYAAMPLNDYKKLVEATKAQEARTGRTRPRNSYM